MLRQRIDAARPCARRAAAAPPMITDDTALDKIVRASVERAEALCRHDEDCHRSSRFFTRQSDFAGCPFPVRSRAGSLNEPSVEACIRLGYWWNRPYCADSLLRHPPNGVHLVNASSGRPIHLPVFDAKRIETFTSRRWPFAIPSASRLAVAIDPSDSVTPSNYPCEPVLVAARVASWSYNATHDRNAPDNVIWPGLTIGLNQLKSHSLAFYRDTPWASKAERLVYRGAINMCWALDGACKVRDIAADPSAVHSQGSRLVAWKTLHSWSQADIEFSSPISSFDVDGNKRKGIFPGDRERWFKNAPAGSLNPWFLMAKESIERNFPEQAGNATTARLRQTFLQLKKAAMKLCRKPPSRYCIAGTRPAVLSALEQSQYKIILAVDGESYMGSFGWAQLTSSAVMAPLSAYETYQEVGMRPWVHFIPTRADFSDAIDNAKWCFAHDRECEAIGAAGRAHMMRLFAEDPSPPSNPPPPPPPPIRYNIMPDPGRALHLSEYEMKVSELMVAHLTVSARRCLSYV